MSSKKVDNEGLTREQLNQQDFIDNTIHQFINDILIGMGKKTETDYEWDIDEIGEIRDAVEEFLEIRYGIKPYEFYPWIRDEEEEG